MTARRLVPTHLVLVIMAIPVLLVAPAAAQTDAATADGCGPIDLPCWVALSLGASGLLLLLVIIRTTVLARRIARRPGTASSASASASMSTSSLPPDLRGADAPAPPIAPLASFPVQHAPWPDERTATDAPAKRRPAPSTGQVTWGIHRLWFNDGAYLFATDADVGDDWLPCFTIPKSHRVVVGPDGIPALERIDPRHRRS